MGLILSLTFKLIVVAADKLKYLINLLYKTEKKKTIWES